MGGEQDKPQGTEQHEPGADPAREGPGGNSGDEQAEETRPPATGEPRGDESPGRPGVTNPKSA